MDGAHQVANRSGARVRGLPEDLSVEFTEQAPSNPVRQRPGQQRNQHSPQNGQSRQADEGLVRGGDQRPHAPKSLKSRPK